jgi:hypothetical protein
MTTDLARELAAESKPPSPIGTYVLLAAPLYLFMLASCALFWLFALPWLDRQLWPVLDQQRVSRVTWSQEDRRLCWAWEFSKTQVAKPVHVAFEVRDRTGDVSSVFPYRADTGASFDARSGVQRNPGRHLVPLCALMPEGIESPWVVSGYIDYHTTRWWASRAESPAIMPSDGKSTDGNNG